MPWAPPWLRSARPACALCRMRSALGVASAVIAAGWADVESKMPRMLGEWFLPADDFRRDRDRWLIAGSEMILPSDRIPVQWAIIWHRGVLRVRCDCCPA